MNNPALLEDRKFWTFLKILNFWWLFRIFLIWTWNFHPKPQICLVFLYIAFVNIKEYQANRLFRREIPSSNQKYSEKSSKFWNFQKSPKYFIIYECWVIHFRDLKILETMSRDFRLCWINVSFFSTKVKIS